MMRRTPLLALVLLAGMAPEAGAQERPPAPCLELSLGPWTGPREMGGDSLEYAPPPRVRLDPRGAGEMRGQHAHEPAGAVPSIHSYSGWRASPAGDTLSLSWSTGFAGLSASLVRREGRYEGPATTFTDDAMGPRYQATMAAVPVECGAPARLTLASLRPVPGAIGLRSGDSVRLGIPLAEVRGVERTEGCRDVRLTTPLGEPFAGATEVRLVPDRDGLLGRIALTLPPGTDSDALLRALTARYGEPTGRFQPRLRSGEDEMLTWSNRVSTLAVTRSRLTGQPWTTRATLTLHRFGQRRAPSDNPACAA